MSAFIYSLGLWFYKLLISLVAWVNPKAELFIRGRKNVWQSLEDQVAVNTSPLLWVHCSSVGEYEQGRPVMEAFKNEFSDFKILVTFYSPSGYEAVSTDAIVNFKTYLPFDSKTNANRFLDLVKPEIAIFIKYEFWYFFLKELYRRDLPVYSVSSIFRPSQLFFKFYGGFYRNILKNISYFFVQDKNSSDLLNSLNLPNLVSGDTRIDRVLDIRNNNKSLPVIEMFVGDEVVMVIGSMRKEDLDIVIQFVIQHRDLKFIIAPHEIIDSMIMPLEERLNSTVRYSEFKNSDLAQQVLIIDNIGMLSTLYRYAHYTYVGGGFSDGLHNILEPAVYEIPVFFGNRDYQRFKEALDLINLGAAFPVGSLKEFDTLFNELQNDSQQQLAIKDNLHQYHEANKGASKKIINRIKESRK